jgi:hypothetical protein
MLAVDDAPHTFVLAAPVASGIRMPVPSRDLRFEAG